MSTHSPKSPLLPRPSLTTLSLELCEHILVNTSSPSSLIRTCTRFHTLSTRPATRRRWLALHFPILSRSVADVVMLTAFDAFADEKGYGKEEEFERALGRFPMRVVNDQVLVCLVADCERWERQKMVDRDRGGCSPDSGNGSHGTSTPPPPLSIPVNGGYSPTAMRGSQNGSPRPSTGPDPEHVNSNEPKAYNILLRWCAARGFLRTLEYLLSQHNSRSSSPTTSISSYSDSSSLHAPSNYVRFAKYNYSPGELGVALSFAAACGQDPAATILLRHGADVHANDDDALRYALGRVTPPSLCFVDEDCLYDSGLSLGYANNIGPSYPSELYSGGPVYRLPPPYPLTPIYPTHQPSDGNTRNTMAYRLAQKSMVRIPPTRSPSPETKENVLIQNITATLSLLRNLLDSTVPEKRKSTLSRAILQALTAPVPILALLLSFHPTPPQDLDLDLPSLSEPVLTHLATTLLSSKLVAPSDEYMRYDVMEAVVANDYDRALGVIGNRGERAWMLRLACMRGSMRVARLLVENGDSKDEVEEVVGARGLCELDAEALGIGGQVVSHVFDRPDPVVQVMQRAIEHAKSVLEAARNGSPPRSPHRSASPAEWVYTNGNGTRPVGSVRSRSESSVSSRLGCERAND
ncbi:hypothetical protein BJ742DRAFT_833938, partial [Cladochytrium replicatum]